MHPADATRSNKANDNTSIGGVVPIRSRSRSRERKCSSELYKSEDIEDAKDEDAGLRNQNDFKRKQVGWTWFRIRNF